MKATIFKTDGTRIEAEGTPEEIARLAGLATVITVTPPTYPWTWPTAPWWYQPSYRPMPWWGETFCQTSGSSSAFIDVHLENA